MKERLESEIEKVTFTVMNKLCILEKSNEKFVSNYQKALQRIKDNDSTFLKHAIFDKKFAEVLLELGCLQVEHRSLETEILTLAHKLDVQEEQLKNQQNLRNQDRKMIMELVSEVEELQQELHNESRKRKKMVVSSKKN